MTALVGASERDALQQLVDDLDRDRDFGTPPVVARVYASGQREVDRLDGADTALSEWLLGWRAPGDCTAVAAAAGGWALHPEHAGDADLERGAFRGPKPRDRRDSLRVTTVMAVSRTGLELARLRIADGRIEESVPDGLVADCLRRAMGRPTRPPALGTGSLFAVLWLDHILELSARRPAPLSWAMAARAHPAMELFEQCGERLPVASLVEVARAMANVLDWSQVRYEIVERAWLNAICRPEIAAWMDDGMLSRWLLSAWPSVEELAASLSDAVDARLATRIRAALRELEVLARERAG